MDEGYRFDDASLGAIAANGVDWRDVLYVLHRAHPQLRRHIGAVFQVTAATESGDWIGVTGIEEGDNEYLITNARHLTNDERQGIERLFGGRP